MLAQLSYPRRIISEERFFERERDTLPERTKFIDWEGHKRIDQGFEWLGIVRRRHANS
jgi:hypothetical protein